VLEPNLDAAARWLVPYAQEHFAQAARILNSRPKGHLVAPRLMESAYARILRRLIAQGGTRRASVWARRNGGWCWP
jgi:phytoene synthase